MGWTSSVSTDVSLIQFLSQALTELFFLHLYTLSSLVQKDLGLRKFYIGKVCFEYFIFYFLFFLVHKYVDSLFGSESRIFARERPQNRPKFTTTPDRTQQPIQISEPVLLQ